MINVTVNIARKISVVAKFNTIVNQVSLPATAENSDQTWSASVAPGGTLVTPDIQFTDSDLQVYQLPSVKNIIATPCVANAGIAYQKIQITGTTQQYSLYDDYWQLQNNPYPEQPSNPLYTQELDKTVVGTLIYLTLKFNNVFENKIRFTDSLGGSNYSVVGSSYDHLTGIEYAYLTFTGTYDAALTHAKGLSLNGHTDWKVANLNEVINLWSAYARSRGLGILTDQNASTSMASSTTRYDVPTYAHVVTYTTGGGVTLKTQSSVYVICRNWFGQ